jgi:hypothetical protein
MTSACADHGDSGGPYYTAWDNNRSLAGTLFSMHVDSEREGCPTNDRTFAVHIYYQMQYHKVQVVTS